MNWNAICLYEFSGGQNGTGTDFFPNNLLFHVTIIPSMLHNHSYTTNTTQSQILTASFNEAFEVECRSDISRLNFPSTQQALPLNNLAEHNVKQVKVVTSVTQSVTYQLHCFFLTISKPAVVFNFKSKFQTFHFIKSQRFSNPFKMFRCFIFKFRHASTLKRL